MHWDIAPENPARLDDAGVTFALTSHGLRDQAHGFWASATSRGTWLKADSALRHSRQRPLPLLGMSDRLGKIAPVWAGNVLIADGDFLFKKSQRKSWRPGSIGRRFEIERPS